jgi:hypothetical protein
MSYEGRTNIVLRHAFAWSGQNYTAPVDTRQTSSFRAISSRQHIRNTFHFNWLKLQSQVGYANTAWVYALQFDPTVVDSNYLRFWDMYDTNGYTVSSRWYPPYSHGIASTYSRIAHNFINSTGNTGNRYLSLEY